MYETSKNFIASVVSRQIGNALSVAESTVDHFLPPAEQKPAVADQNGSVSTEGNGHDAHHNGNANGHTHNGVIETESSLGRFVPLCFVFYTQNAEKPFVGLQ